MATGFEGEKMHDRIKNALLDVLEDYEEQDLNAPIIMERQESLPVSSKMATSNRLYFAKSKHSNHNLKAKRESNSEPEEPVDMFSYEYLAGMALWWFPIINTLKTYNKELFIFDIRAAASISFVLIPQAIAFSALAGVEPIYALVSAIFPLLIYAIIGGSRQLSVGPEALSSVLVGLVVAREIEKTEGKSFEIAAALGFIVGFFAILLAILRAGFIDNILSGFLLTGFVLGVANLIMIEQVPGMFGLVVEKATEPHSTFETAVHVFSKFGTAKGSAATLGILSLLFLIAFKFIKKKYGHHNPWVCQIPEILLLVLISTIFSAVLDFKSKGIPTLGSFNNTLPVPAFPNVTYDFFMRVLPDVVLITIVGYIESQTVTRSFGLKNGYFPSGDRELFALGTSNVVGSLFGAYVTFGSLPRSRILASSGGKTTLAGAMAATIVLILTTTMGSVLKYLPKPTLAAIVMNAAINLIEYEEIFYLFKMRNPTEIFHFLATWALTIFVSIDDSIVFCLGMSALFIMRQTTTVKLGLLGKHTYSIRDGSGQYTQKISFADVQDFPEAQLIPGLLVISIKSPLEFYNAGRLRRRIEIMLEIEKRHLDAENADKVETRSSSSIQKGQRFSTLFVNSTVDIAETGLDIVIDFSKCQCIDSNACHVLKKICKNFKKQDVRMKFTGVNPDMRLLMDRGEVTHEIGACNIYSKIDDALIIRQ